MFSKNDDCMIPLIQYLREHSDDTLVSVNIFINAAELIVTTEYKSADDLEIEGISMRNLRGEFITNKEIKLDKNGNVKTIDNKTIHADQNRG